MSITCRSSKRFSWLLVFLLVFSVAGDHLWGQNGNGEEGLPPVPVELTGEAIQKRIEQIKQRGNLKQETRDELITTYQDAINELNDTRGLEAEIEKLREIKENASREIQENKNRQEELLEKPELSVPEQATIENLMEEIEKTGVFIPDEPDLSFLEQKLNDTESELENIRTKLEEVRKKLNHMKSGREQLQEKVNKKKDQLTELIRELKAISIEEEPNERTVAKVTLLHAKKQKIETLLRKLDLEKTTYEPRRDLYQSEEQLLNIREKRLDKIHQIWRKIVNQNIERKAKEELEQTKEELTQIRESYPAIEELARQVKRLAEERASEDGPIQGLKQATERLESTKNLRDSISSDLQNIKDRIEAAGLTSRLGRMLRRKKNDLPSHSEHNRDITELENKRSDVQIRLIELNETRSRLIEDRDEKIQEYLRSLKSGDYDDKHTELKEKITDLYTRRLGLINTLIEDYDRYFTRLSDLVSEKRKLVDVLREYRGYINKRVIWIRSTNNYFYLKGETDEEEGDTSICQTAPGKEANLWDLPPAIQCYFRTTHWTGIGTVIRKDFRNNYLFYLLFLVLIGLLLRYRGRFREKLSEAGEGTFSRFDDSIYKTVNAILYSMFLTLPLPGIFLFLGWRLYEAANGGPAFAVAAGLALVSTGGYTAVLSGLYHTCHPDGLGRNHFRWKKENIETIRRNILHFLYPAIPFVFVFVQTGFFDDPFLRDSLGRTCFLVTMILGAWFVKRVLSPAEGIVSGVIDEHSGGWLDRMRYVWYPVATGVPILFAVLAVFGYYYTARQLLHRLGLTFVLFIGLLYIVEYFVRWQLFQNIQFAVRKRQERRKSQEEESQEGKEIEENRTPSGQEEHEKSTFSLLSVNEQTRQLMWSLFWLGLAVGVWVIWADVLPALSMLDEVELWSHPMQVVETVTGEGGETVQQTVEKQMAVTLQDLLAALVILVMTVIITKNLPGLLEITILQYLPMDTGLRYAYKTISRYLIVMLGLLLIAGNLGIRWSDVQWLAAAVTVGLGFGLQEIFANFVSGLIILFERPIRVGDTVTVNDVTGRVTRIRTRATTILDLDRKELIVPNRNFIQEELVNWTLSDSIMRVVIPIGVAYGSDTELVEEKLMEITREEDIVLEEPKPSVIFTGFGDNALQFSLRFFIQDYDNYWKAFHQINRAVDREFREAGITIAFPQRDLHLKSVDDDLSISIAPEQIPDDAEESGPEQQDGNGNE